MEGGPGGGGREARLVAWGGRRLCVCLIGAPLSRDKRDSVVCDASEGCAENQLSKYKAHISTVFDDKHYFLPSIPHDGCSWPWNAKRMPLAPLQLGRFSLSFPILS